MYSIDIIKSSIKLYFKLEQQNIIGKERIKIINSTFDLHINTLYRWINIYYNYYNNTFSFNQYNTHFKYNNIKINYEIEQFIINSIDSNNNFNIKIIKKNIKNKYNILLSKPTIYNVLHKNNLTYKKIIIKTNPLKSENENELKKNLKNKIKETDINNLSSYDEMSIYINDVPNYGWSKKGKKCIIINKNNSVIPKRITLGMCITMNKNIDFTLTEGSLKSNKFINFMNKVKINTNNKLTFFLDNASIHRSKIFQKYIKENNLKIIYNVPYHSHLNPIEYIFSLLRRELLNGDTSSLENIGKIITNFKKNLDKDIIKNIFNKCINEIKEFI
jgi:transposase